MSRTLLATMVLASATVPGRAQVPSPDPSAAQVPEGYRVEVVLKDLTYPTSVEFDTDGAMYVVEAGYSYGDPSATPRILRVDRTGQLSTLVRDGLNGPVADLLYHDGRLYVSHRGKISIVENGSLRDLVTGLPSEGDHHTNQMTVGPDGRIYFGQGTVTNSGVVGPDNFRMGWLKKHPNLHDVPARDISLRARSFTSEDLLAEKGGEAHTGAFQPFGQGVPADRTVRGTTKASGTILRMNPDGSGLEVYAWGLRNPFGVMWSPDGKLYASENGFDARGSRPIANDKEDLYEIEEGAWYGWPDYASGVPVTDARYRPKEGPAPEFVMADHPPVETPILTFPEHSAATKLAISPGGIGDEGDLFLAFFGHMAPMTGTVEGEHGGHRVVRIDPVSKQIETFFTKKEEHGHRGGGTSPGSKDQGHGDQERGAEKPQEPEKTGAGQQGGSQHGSAGHGQQGESLTPGPRRLVDVVFSPDGGALYVVDFGAMVVEKEPKPFPGSGVVWRISRDGAKVVGPPANLSARNVR